MNDVLIHKTIALFEQQFQSTPVKVVLSPGRINIIGEHIDYNDGYVLPAAIDKIICFAFEKNNSNTARITAIDLDDSIAINIKEPVLQQEKVWANYLLGVIGQLQNSGLPFEGFDCVFSSNIPVGSGLSSSAALECGFLYGINTLFNLGLRPLNVALMGQKAEHWVGINCGIMDQFSSVFGMEGKVIKIDCRNYDFEYHNADFSDYSLILFDSNVKHSLFTSAYNKRREECEEGFAIIQSAYPEIKSFRDCDESHVLTLRNQLPENVFRRCHFVVKEIARVNKACEALDLGNIELLGQLLFEGHDGLSKEYEVCCPETDYIVNWAKTQDAIVGSRQMGGGFGGCAITLIRKGHETEIKEKLTSLYAEKFGIELKIYDVKVGNGTSLYTK
ncbi:MAG: galactokinase [Flavobacterium sp.]|nr:galactokinase [Flavobacterium sp.]